MYVPLLYARTPLPRLGCSLSIHNIDRPLKLVFLIAGIAAITSPIPASAQELSSATDTTVAEVPVVQGEGAPVWHAMITNLPGDWKTFAVDNFSTQTLLPIAALVGVTGALIVADDYLWRATDEFSNVNPTTRTITHAFAEIGDGKTIFGLAGAFALTGWVINDTRALRTASQLVQSHLAVGITVQVLKRITGRERPERQSVKSGRWRPLPNQKEYHQSVPKFDAFPSGHTAAAMAMVTVLIENYPELEWLRPVGYAAVGLVAFSLAARGWHWYSDYPLAIALGYQFGKIAARPASTAEPDVPGSLHLEPALTPEGAGLKVSLRF